MTDVNTLARPSREAYEQSGAAIQRLGFGTTEVEARRETQATALAERAKAEIQARYIVAIQRPRSWPSVWARLIEDCTRPGFAEGALYAVKRGSKKDERGQWVDNIAIGFTVGFAMSAMRTMGNVDASYIVVYEDEERVTYRVSVTDIESNVTQSKDVRIAKRIERSKVREGQRVISTRQNTDGKPVYLVEATDEELENKSSSAISKAKRNMILDILPVDLKQDCRATIDETRTAGDRADPDRARKQMIARFHSIGISPEMIVKHLGHPLEQIQPAELNDLRNMFTAIRDGETTWAELTREEPAEPASEAVRAAEAASKVREHLARGKESGK